MRTPRLSSGQSCAELPAEKRSPTACTLQTFYHAESLLSLGDVSTTGSTVRRQHEQDIVDPPSIIELFQQHAPDITLVGTIELIRMHEAVTLLVFSIT